MGDNTLTRAVSGQRARASQLNQLITAIVEDVLARNNDGIVEDSAGSLGSDTNKWKDLYLSGFIYGADGIQGGFVPSGVMLPYTCLGTPPQGWILANGDTIGAAGSGADHEGEEYRYLFNKYKSVTSYGNSGSEDFDSLDTVKTPNPDGRYLRSFGTQNPDGGSLGSTLGDQNKQHNHPHDHTLYVDGHPVSKDTSSVGGSGDFFNVPATRHSGRTPTGVLYKAYSNSANSGGSENRPKTMSVYYIIKV